MGMRRASEARMKKKYTRDKNNIMYVLLDSIFLSCIYASLMIHFQNNRRFYDIMTFLQ